MSVCVCSFSLTLFCLCSPWWRRYRCRPRRWCAVWCWTCRRLQPDSSDRTDGEKHECISNWKELKIPFHDVLMWLYVCYRGDEDLQSLLLGADVFGGIDHCSRGAAAVQLWRGNKNTKTFSYFRITYRCQANIWCTNLRKNSSKSELRCVFWPQSGWDAGSPSALPVWCLYSCCRSACRTPSRPPPPEDTTENIKTEQNKSVCPCVSVCVCVVYPVLVGETPDPSGHFHSEDEEQEEEELQAKTRVTSVCWWSSHME